VNTTVIAMGIALLVVVGMIVQLGILSLLVGAFHFLFGKPKIDFLKTQKGENGFAFGFRWNNSREPAKFNKIKVRLFNPFTKPTQVDVTSEFAGQTSDFAMDLDFGPALKRILDTDGLDNSTIQIEVSAAEGIVHQFDMKTRKFLEGYRAATMTADEFNEKYGYKPAKKYYSIPQRTFIADPLPSSGKTLKISANPEFAGDFAAAGGAGDAPKEDFTVAKVWIEDGCIVCNACEAAAPDVFEVPDSGAVVKSGAPLTQGLAIQEAADACPVEIIKFQRA
jgi:ferredoxin